MPRKPTLKKLKITVLVKGVPIPVSLHPPTETRKSWYAYWNGLISSKSTGHSDLDEAIRAVEDMLKNGGERSTLADTLPTDEEFCEIQRRHYAKKSGDAAQERSQKSRRECLDAISAFKHISGLEAIASATVEDCERFQEAALKKPRNWRRISPKNLKEDSDLLSPSTVRKWIVALQAAFDRANKNAGRKCVRGVVPSDRLLTNNPWKEFTWVQGREKPLRQFAPDELLAILDHFQRSWSGLMFAPAYVKVCLWSWARREEVSGLRWENFRQAGNECHFKSTGKWDVTKWFRLPPKLVAELRALPRTDDHVFSGYADELRNWHLKSGNSSAARQVRSDFHPSNVGEWMYRQIRDISSDLPNGAAYLHVFRKTTIQLARSGEDQNARVAKDASVGEDVMMASYAEEGDPELRHRSNRMFRRIRSSLPADVACRFGYEDSPLESLLEQLDAARATGDWERVREITDSLIVLKKQAN